MPIDSLFCLPDGLVALRLDFGARLRRFRRDEGLTQAELAKHARLGRGTVSRVETGLVQPRPDTIDAIMAVLELDMGQLAVRGSAARSRKPARYFDGSSRGESRHRIGRAIREGRRVEGMSLREVAERSGLSAPQLCRIERGEGERSAVYEDYPEDTGWPRADRRFRLANVELQRLANVGFKAEAAARRARDSGR